MFDSKFRKQEPDSMNYHHLTEPAFPNSRKAKPLTNTILTFPQV